MTDNYGCVDTLDFVINELPPLVLDVVDSTDPLCNGDDNGTAEVVATGGTTPYNYSWNSNPVQNTALATDLFAGTYNATVTDSNGCQAFAQVQLIDPPVLIADAQVLGNNICFGDKFWCGSGSGIGRNTALHL